MSQERKQIIPRWAVCGAGRIGRVTEREQQHNNVTYYGERLEGGPWQSKMPIFLHPNTQRFLESVYSEDPTGHV